MMKRVADRGFKAGEQPSGTIRTRVTSCQRDSGAILREHVQCVIASEQPYPAQGEILFDNLERIILPSNYASHSFEQVSAHVSTFYVASNFRLATLGANRTWKEMAQKKWPVFCNLLIKDQCVPYCIGRFEEILAGCNRSGVVLPARQLAFYGWFHSPAVIRLQ